MFEIKREIGTQIAKISWQLGPAKHEMILKLLFKSFVSAQTETNGYCLEHADKFYLPVVTSGSTVQRKMQIFFCKCDCLKKI